MDCANESRVVDAALRACKGVTDVHFELLQHSVTVSYDDGTTNPAALIAAIRRTGYHAASKEFSAAEQDAAVRRQLVTAGIAALLLVIASVLNTRLVPAWPAAFSQGDAARVLFACSMVLSSRHFAPRAWHSLRQLQADMNLLVTIAAIGAVLLGDWMEGALVTLLFAVAHLLERWSTTRVRKSIDRFLSLMPRMAERVDTASGEVASIPIHALRAGDLLLVKPGALVPADGTVESGWSTADQSAITGEAFPVELHPGAPVLGGSTNGSGAIQMRATRDAEHSRASRLESAIQQAQAQRSPTERWVERFARIYTPLVIVAAAAVAVIPPLAGGDWRVWFYHSLVVLLIACPCALVISTPVTMVSAISALARMGILVRGGESIERAARIQAVAFDKTGVLTTGQLRVHRIHAMEDVDLAAALSMAASVERLSEHPVAQALVAYAGQHGGIPAADSFQAFPGMGGEGLVGKTSVWVGSPAFAAQRGAWSEDAEEASRQISDGGALVAAGSGGCLWLIASLSDAPRAESGEAIRMLAASGIQRLTMLSGDHAANCDAVATVVGITEVHSALLPEEKLALLREIEARSGPVAMVGDGINDAPAMAAASLSVAAGARASEVTLQAADAVMWDGDMRRVPLLLQRSREAMAVVRQNVVLAIGSKAAFAVLAAFGLATLWMAVVADVGATLLVTANGLRLLKARHDMTIETSSRVADPITSS